MAYLRYYLPIRLDKTLKKVYNVMNSTVGAVSSPKQEVHMDTEEIFEPTDAEFVVMVVITTLYLVLVVWPVTGVAYLYDSNPWRSPRVGGFLRQVKTWINQFIDWLECPAPDQPRPAENLSSLSNRIMTALAIVVIAATLISLTVLWNFSRQ